MYNLGLATPEQVEPRLLAWLNRPPSHETHDDDAELAGFLTELFRAGIIGRSQGRTLLAMLSERPAPPADDPYVGRRFGSFIAEERVGEGAMGKVYRASREGTLERDFVVKVFDQSREDNAVRRFRREGDVMSTLDHPNIVKVVGAGEEGGLLYLVLQYCEGPTLAELIEQRGRFSWKSATRAVKQIAAALSAAHEKGIIHRDVKPQNILVAPGGLLKVFDFGLAKTLDSKASSLSQAGDILGSPAFMAPEQWGDHQVDERADLFSLGVIYYLLLSGQLPFKGRTPADYALAIRERSYTPLRELVPELPLDVQAVVDQLLERDRAWRCPSAARLLSDLDRLLRGKAPNLPRLERLGAAEQVEERIYLVGKASFTLGRDLEAHGFFDLEGVELLHARIERADGLVLAAHGPVLVNGKPAREIALRDRDTIALGAEGPRLRFRLGNLSRRSSTRLHDPLRESSLEEDASSPSPGPPTAVPGLLLSALAASAHPRALVHCFESLDPRAARGAAETARDRLRAAGLSPEELQELPARTERLISDAGWKTADALFTRTRENLGREVVPWLRWWFGTRAKFPAQFMPPVPRAAGELKVRPRPEARSFRFDLLGAEDWVVGRSEDCDLCIEERSVSRQHLRLHRLNRRYAYVDLGSRFGTTVAEKRVSAGLLDDGDSLRLGRAKLTFRDHLRTTTETTAPGAPVEVDEHTFRALVDLRSRAVVLTLVRLLDTPALTAFCERALAVHEPPEPARPGLSAFLETQRELALEALPAICGCNHGSDAVAWQRWWSERGAEFGPQAIPAGWGKSAHWGR